MKLLVCIECGDIFNLNLKEKFCSCGKTKGRYTDELNAVISGPCAPIGFANNSFIKAYKAQTIEDKEYNLTPERYPAICCEGIEFKAFFIPAWARSIKKQKHE